MLFGIDKSACVLIDAGARCLAAAFNDFIPAFNDFIPGDAPDAMHIVGVVEILAGRLVAVAPRFCGLLVAG
jgi:hypothetical protein